MDFLKDFFLFCPICKKKMKPEENQQLKEIVREKAKVFAQKYSLQNLIKNQQFEILDIFTKFKKLEDSCKFCPDCHWTPFTNLIADNVFKQYSIDFPEEIKNSTGTYLLDYLYAKQKKGTPKKTVQNLIKEDFFKKD